MEQSYGILKHITDSHNRCGDHLSKHFLKHVEFRKGISVRIEQGLERSSVASEHKRFENLFVSLYLSPPLLLSVGCSCSCKASFPWRRSPTVGHQSSRHHSLWYNVLKSTSRWQQRQRHRSIFLIVYWQKETSEVFLVLTAGQSRLWRTIIQGFRSRPFDRDLSEATLCRVDTIILLTGHPKVTDLHQVVFSNQTVPRCQVPS